MWTAKTLIRPGGCPGWPESSLGTVILLVLSWGGSDFHKKYKFSCSKFQKLDSFVSRSSYSNYYEMFHNNSFVIDNNLDCLGHNGCLRQTQWLVPQVYFCNMSHLKTKPTKWMCAQRRLWSAWASAQSDQSLRRPHEKSLGPSLSIESTSKTLIRLGGCRAWSVSLLGAQSVCWFCREVAHRFVSSLKSDSLRRSKTKMR